MSGIPDVQEFFNAASERARATAAFARTAGEVGELDEEQTRWLEVGIAAAVTATVEELNRRGMLRPAS